MTNLPKSTPVGFDDPTALPQTREQAAAWQEHNRNWWQSHPMRYDWNTPLAVEEFSPEFYERIDRQFFSDAQEYLPARTLPFDRLIPFDGLPEWDVLEIGVGSGSHAGLLARHARSFTGIDLTEYAVRSTSNRLRLAGLNARVEQMDAEQMAFPDASFDFIWSWGVIHHSSDTSRILREMHRVLRPGGRATVMIYHRNFWNYYICSGLLHGLIRGLWFRTHSIHKVMQLVTDGGLARFYTLDEWTKLTSECFRIDKMEVMGPKSHMVALPAGRFKDAVQRLIPAPVARLFANRLRMGYFLVAQMTRRD